MGHPEPGEELVQDPDEITEGQTHVADDTLHLVKLGEVRSIHRFVAEHPVHKTRRQSF